MPEVKKTLFTIGLGEPVWFKIGLWAANEYEALRAFKLLVHADGKVIK